MKLSIEQQGKIKKMICEILEVNQEEMTSTSHFADDHGADSLRGIEILAGLERIFKVKIPQSELSKMFNLSGVVEQAEKYMSTKE